MGHEVVLLERKQLVKKRILMISSDLLPNISANGVCVHNLACEYVQQGHQVYCITSRLPGQNDYEVIDGIQIYRIKEAWFGRFQARCVLRGKIGRLWYRGIHLLRNVCLLPLYPNVSPIRALQVYRLAFKLITEENIDIVIGTFRPYESIYAVLKLKRRFGEQLTCISYYLDMLLQNQPKRIGQSFYKQSSIRAQKKDIRLLDRVIIPASNQSEFEKLYGKHDNVAFLEFPMYVPQLANTEMDFPFCSEKLNLVYVGTLNQQDRNPERLLRLLSAVQGYLPNIRLHIWGKSEEVQDALMHYPELAQCHGYAPSEIVPSILQNADWVINITNRQNANMIPSKIFQLFASGKPVLNYVNKREDISLPYFDRYENTYTVYDDQADDPSTVEALVGALQKQWPSVNADEEFRENTPAFVAERVIRA